MFWLYIPPIIFIAALVALVVILGKKTAALKKSGHFESVEAERVPRSGIAEGRLKKVKIYSLRALEWVMGAVKTGAKSLEEGLANALKKIKEKRTNRSRGEKTEIDSGRKENIVRYIREEEIDLMTDEEIGLGGVSEKIGGARQNLNMAPSEVVVKRKPEVVPQRILPQRAVEDRVKEDALVHRIAENPKDVEAYRELGDYYLSVGNLKDAKESFKMVLKLRPRDLKAKSSLREMEMRIRLGEKI